MGDKEWTGDKSYDIYDHDKEMGFTTELESAPHISWPGMLSLYGFYLTMIAIVWILDR
jgi:hypothetical protein